jgi:hypothetical protein
MCVVTGENNIDAAILLMTALTAVSFMPLTANRMAR